MNLSAYKAIYSRFGLGPMLHDMVISAIEKIVRFRLMFIYLHSQITDLGEEKPDKLEIHEMTREELDRYIDSPGLELPHWHVDQALANGDKCIGAFMDGELCSYAWYAENPSTSSNRLTTYFDKDYAYAYKNLTIPKYRGQHIQRWVKNYALALYQKQGKKGVLVAIDSNNFSSRRTTASVGAKVIGYFAYFLGKKRYAGFNLKGCRKVGYRLEKARGLW